LLTLKLSFKPEFGNRKVLIHIRALQFLSSWKRIKLILVKPHHLARLAQIKMDLLMVSADRKFSQGVPSAWTHSIRPRAFNHRRAPEFLDSVTLQIFPQHRHIYRYARASFTFP
jgi:hypothetical protein